MDALWSECVAHGYAAPAAATDAAESPFVQQLRQLMELSRLVEAATLRLTTLQTQASFEDLVNPMALERKAALLREIESRATAVVAGKDRILAFVQGQHARHGALAIEASRQAVVVELFERMQRDTENAEALLEALEWGGSEAAPPTDMFTTAGSCALAVTQSTPAMMVEVAVLPAQLNTLTGTTRARLATPKLVPTEVPETCVP